MRGKHASAARNRRVREELEQRASTAERKVDRLEKDVAELKEDYEGRLAALRELNVQLTRERDSAASPALEAEMAAGDRLREQLRDRAQSLSWNKQMWEQTLGALPTTLAAEGLSREQVTRVMKTLAADGKRAAFSLTAEAWARNQLRTP